MDDVLILEKYWVSLIRTVVTPDFANLKNVIFLPESVSDESGVRQHSLVRGDSDHRSRQL